VLLPGLQKHVLSKPALLAAEPTVKVSVHRFFSFNVNLMDLDLRC